MPACLNLGRLSAHLKQLSSNADIDLGKPHNNHDADQASGADLVRAASGKRAEEGESKSAQMQPIRSVAFRNGSNGIFDRPSRMGFLGRISDGQRDLFFTYTLYGVDANASDALRNTARP